MGERQLTPDALDRIIVQGELEIARIRATQMAAISVHKAMGTHTRDGYRSIVDWAAARADISHQTARKLCWTASRLQDKPEVSKALADGEMTFDRAEQLARLPDGEQEDNEHLDISQLRRKAALHRRISRGQEREVQLDQILHIQPDEDRFNFWGALDPIGGAITEKALDQVADELITDGDLSVAERRALALIAICQDSLYEAREADGASTSLVTVSVDTREAAHTDGEAGVAVLNGPRVGCRALEAIACDAVVEVIGISSEGKPLNLGRRSRTIPPLLRRHILDRDGGCTVAGCTSRYRLQVHHAVPWSRGGTTDADNLIALCWFHHHVVIHRWGYEIERVGKSLIRLIRPDSTDPP